MKRVSAILIWLAIVAIGVSAIGRLNLQLVSSRRTYGISQTDPLVNAPPLVVFTTVALGGFRGIIADFLWMRSARLQYEGKYFELVQLADWITKLEPRFTDVWAYHAWNLAYNISVMFSDYGDRWRWVRHGFSLLRDEGLLYNPGEPHLLYELGWIFQHKIGGTSDDAHLYYKEAWADEMKALLGSGRPDLNLLDAATVTRMKQVYKLDPALMTEIEKDCGPLDWELPQAHAIYWATESRNCAHETFDIIAANRMIYQSLSDAFRRGRLAKSPDGSRIVPSPLLELYPYAIRAYERAISVPAIASTATDALRVFLSEAVTEFYVNGRMTEARDALSRLAAMTPELSDSMTIEEFVLATTVNRYAMKEKTDTFAPLEDVLLQQSYWRMSGNDELAGGYGNLAAILVRWYAASGTNVPLDQLSRDAERRAAETIDRMR